MDSVTLLKGIQLTQAQVDERYFYRRMHLKLFVNESTFSERLRFYFIKNQTTSLRIRLFKLSVKLLTVVLYMIRAALERPYEATCCGFCPRGNVTVHPDSNPLWDGQYNFSWNHIFFVDRPYPIWYLQVILAFISFSLEVINTFVQYKGNLCQQIFCIHWFLELFCCSGPFIATTFYSPLRCLWVPVFFNIWLAKSGLESIINDLHRVAHKQQSAMFNQVALLLSTLLCLLVTCICGVQHLERAGEEYMDLFDAMWFSVVTFSTVGYGDITPTIWLSKLLIVILIIAALVIIPSQLEKILILYTERQKQGGEYSRQRAKTEKHVVVCSTVLRMDVILDFLHEFYAHPILQNYYVVLLSPMELHGPLQQFLQIPIWAERVIYIQGSLLRENDLKRVKMDEAESCFILTSRQEPDRVAADEKTILRAMAVKDYAPGCPLYVQILQPESMLHVQFADKVICDEEFKYVLVGMNSSIPAISTLITLLAHTSKGQEGENLGADWKREFGRSAGNEIYSVVARNSKFFSAYVGHKFSIAASLAHAKYGATLFAVERAGEIRINPGNEYFIDNDDTLFYLCLTQEEDAIIVENTKRSSSKKSNGSSSQKKTHRTVERELTLPDDVFDNDFNVVSPDGRSGPVMGKTRIDFPPMIPYVGHNAHSLCHILEEKAFLCCLRLEMPCEHSRSISAFDYTWPNPPIIISAEEAPPSLFNVLLPLRAYYKPRSQLHPIVLLLEKSPDNSFLSVIRSFPMIYYMLGKMNDLDRFLVAGITKAHSVIILDRKSSMNSEEEYMADAKQLVASQTLYRLFPNLPTCMELTHASNMRFMHFQPTEKLALDRSEYRKNREKEKGCTLPYLFCKSFASGKVYSASMLDTLLYQSFVKDYLITLLRIMLGLQYTAGSGSLSTYEVTESEVGKKYQDVFASLSKRFGYVILGIYRYEEKPTTPFLPVITTTFSNDKLMDVGREQFERTRSSRRYSMGDDLDCVTVPTTKRKSLSNISLSSMRKSVKSRIMGHKKQNIRRMQLIQSTKSEREKLDEMIKSHMQEQDLVEKNFGTPTRTLNNKDRFGYILLNPAGDHRLEKNDVLYIIKPESSLSESRPTSCLSETALSSQSCDDFLEDAPMGEERLNNNLLLIRENEINRRHSIHAIDEEEVGIRIAVPPPMRSETSPV